LGVQVTLVHIVDQSAPEDTQRQLSLFLAAMPQERVRHRLTIAGRPSPVLRVPGGVTTSRLPRINVWTTLCWQGFQWTPGPGTSVVVYAWGEAALSLLPRREVVYPIVGVVNDPGEVHDVGATCRMLERREATYLLACSSTHVGDQLLARRVPEGVVEQTPPGVDFGALRAADRDRIRQELDLLPTDRVLLAPTPPSRAGGQYEAVWATAVLYQIWRNVRLIVPGSFEKAGRVRRLAERCYCPEVFRLTGDQYSPAELLAASDMLVVPAVKAVPAGWLAWAMAAGVPVVGTAVPTIAELIQDEKTGFLAASAKPHALATRIRQAWEDVEARQRCVTAARDRAYSQFRLQKFIDAHLKIVEGLVTQDRASRQANRRLYKLLVRAQRELDL
jgi:glycosyltransferase involved in cell wall biosynthesis